MILMLATLFLFNTSSGMSHDWCIQKLHTRATYMTPDNKELFYTNPSLDRELKQCNEIVKGRTYRSSELSCKLRYNISYYRCTSRYGSKLEPYCREDAELGRSTCLRRLR